MYPAPKKESKGTVAIHPFLENICSGPAPTNATHL